MIKFFKFMTGDDVVGESEDRGEYFYIKWPVKIVMNENVDENADPQSQAPRNRILPFANHVIGHTILVHKSKILFVGEPIGMLADYYEKNFSNLIPPKEEDIKKASGFGVYDEGVVKDIKEVVEAA
jgi:hypothetical protein